MPISAESTGRCAIPKAASSSAMPATSIPAAVISMALLRYFANHSIIENNIVQTIA